MANIQTEINRFKTSVYGKEIRDSLIDSITAINQESENSQAVSQQAKQLAENANIISTAVCQRIDLVASCKPGEAMTDAFPDAPRSMTIYGSSTQDGVPALSAPVPIKGTEGVSISSPFVFGFNLSLHGIKNNKGDYIARDTVDFSRGVIRRECARMELDGTEKWTKYPQPLIITYQIDIPDTALGYYTSLCTHFKNRAAAWSGADEGFYNDHGSVKRKYFRFNGSMDEWKAYLAAQKANGTPVTLVYAAEPREERLLEGTMEQYRTLRHGGGDLPFAAEWSGTPGQLEMTYTQDVARSIRRLQKAPETTAP